MNLGQYSFSEAHTWAKKDGDEVVIGITDFAANELGDIIFVELPDVGSKITVDESMGSIESAKSVEDIITPLSGEVVRVNDNVIDAPELLNEDAYEQGWLVALKLSDPKEFEELLNSDQYTALIEEADDDDDEDEDDLFETDKE